MSKVLIVFGARPELIKLAPVIWEFKKRNLQKKITVLNTGQHKDLLEKYFEIFDTHPDCTFDVMIPGQSLSELTDRAYKFVQENYDWKIINRKLDETILKPSQRVKVVA